MHKSLHNVHLRNMLRSPHMKHNKYLLMAVALLLSVIAIGCAPEYKTACPN